MQITQRNHLKKRIIEAQNNLCWACNTVAGNLSNEAAKAAIKVYMRRHTRKLRLAVHVTGLQTDREFYQELLKARNLDTCYLGDSMKQHLLLSLNSCFSELLPNDVELWTESGKSYSEATTLLKKLDKEIREVSQAHIDTIMLSDKTPEQLLELVADFKETYTAKIEDIYQKGKKAIDAWYDQNKGSFRSRRTRD